MKVIDAAALDYKTLNEVLRQPEHDYVIEGCCGQRCIDDLLSDGYGWQYNVNLRSIDESRALFYHVNDRILKLLRSRVNGATGDTKAHYQSLFYVIERSLYPSQT